MNVLITGANRGIGLALAQYYLSNGHRVICSVRDAQVDTTKDALLPLGLNEGDIYGVSLEQAESVETFVKHLELPHLDILINNAAMGDGEEGAKFETMDAGIWSKVFQVNTIAPLQLTQLLTPTLSSADRPVVAMITSHLASLSLNDSLDSVLYGATKAALNSAIHRISEQETALNYVLIHPGSVQTRLSGFSGTPVKEAAANIVSVIEKLAEGDISSGQFIGADTLEPINW